MSETNGVDVEGIAKQVLENLGNLVVENNLTNGTNETERFKATPEGLFIAYSSLVIMALIPIVIGSFKSVRHQKEQQVIQKAKSKRFDMF